MTDEQPETPYKKERFTVTFSEDIETYSVKMGGEQFDFTEEEFKRILRNLKLFARNNEAIS